MAVPAFPMQTKRWLSALFLTCSVFSFTPIQVDAADRNAPQGPKVTVRPATQKNATALSLDDALEMTYRTNPGLQAGRARLRAIDESIPIARSASMPQAVASGTYGNRSVDSSVATGDSNINPYTYNVKLSQALFRGFRTVNSLGSARANVQAGQAQLTDKEQEILLEAAQAFASVLRDRKIVSLREQNIRVLASVEGQTRNGFEGGDLTKTDIAQAQSRVLAGQAELIRAKAALAESEYQFEKVIGIKPQNLKDISSIDQLVPADLFAALQSSELANPKLKSARYAADAAYYDSRAAVGELLPTVGVEGSYARSYGTNGLSSRQEERSVFLTLSAPIFQGGGEYARIRQSKALESQKFYEAMDAKRFVDAAIASAFAQYNATKQRVQLLERQVKTASDAAMGTQLEFKINRRRIMDVLDAQEEVIQARIGLEAAKYDRTATAFGLLASAGKLTAKNMGLTRSPTASQRGYEAEITGSVPSSRGTDKGPVMGALY
jgi:outer membrane protein